MKNIKNQQGNSLVILLILIALGVAGYYFIGPEKLKATWSLWTSKDTETATSTNTTTGSASSGTTTGNDHDNLIRANNPKPNQLITSPLKVTGEARGTWFFEASFPVRLLDANGKELVALPAQAKSDWMTENFVPFEAELKFSMPETATGTLVLQKDNPSGMPENEDAIMIPVRFK